MSGTNVLVGSQQCGNASSAPIKPLWKQRNATCFCLGRGVEDVTEYGKSKKSEGIHSLTQWTSGASNGEAERWPSDQKVPSWNLIISTVSRLKFKLCAAIWRPSGQGLAESPVIRNASYYHNPKSYLNSSLMRLWFPRTICYYCSPAQMWVGATIQSCLLRVPERRLWSTREMFLLAIRINSPWTNNLWFPQSKGKVISDSYQQQRSSPTRVWTLEICTSYNFNSTRNMKNTVLKGHKMQNNSYRKHSILRDCIMAFKWQECMHIYTYMFQFVQSAVMSDSLCPHGLQHARPPCPSPIPGVY